MFYKEMLQLFYEEAKGDEIETQIGVDEVGRGCLALTFVHFRGGGGGGLGSEFVVEGLEPPEHVVYAPHDEHEQVESEEPEEPQEGGGAVLPLRGDAAVAAVVPSRRIATDGRREVLVHCRMVQAVQPHLARRSEGG